MTKNIIEFVIGDLADKRRWRRYKARVKALPSAYRETVEAVERYLMRSGEIPSDGSRLVTMFGDLVELFEQAAADGTPVRDVVGEDPTEFVDEFVATYSDGGWLAKERERLKKTIDRAAGKDEDA